MFFDILFSVFFNNSCIYFNEKLEYSITAVMRSDENKEQHPRLMSLRLQLMTTKLYNSIIKLANPLEGFKMIIGQLNHH